MDADVTAMLRDSIAAWCSRDARRLERMEAGELDAALWTDSFAELRELGVLDLLHEPETRHDFAIVVEAAHAIAQRSPSLAVLMLQQNLAARVRADAGLAPPQGWASMPLYDACAEWPHRLRVTPCAEGHLLEGSWGLLPGLPVAVELLLPLVPAGPGSFALVRLDLEAAPRVRGAPVLTLGLRGCPVADATFEGEIVGAAAVLAEGAAAWASMQALWSQAEVAVAAVREAVLERAYSVARAYAEGRWQGRKVIARHSLVQRMLAELYGERCALAEQWRGLLSDLAPGRPLRVGQASALARSASAVPRLASDGIQLLGGYGYVEDYGQERLFRDAKQCELLLGHPQAKSFALWESEAGESTREG